MTLFDKIKKLYPSIKDGDFLTSITLQNDADGKDDYIAKWNHPDFKKPTDAQLAAAGE